MDDANVPKTANAFVKMPGSDEYVPLGFLSVDGFPDPHPDVLGPEKKWQTKTTTVSFPIKVETMPRPDDTNVIDHEEAADE